MSDSGAEEAELVAKATSGDRLALQQLLLAYSSRLAQHIGPKLRASVRRVISADDIVQQTFMQAFRDVDQFQSRPDSSFFSWLKTIADHRAQDAIKSLKRMKRGGERVQLYRAPASPSQSRS